MSKNSARNPGKLRQARAMEAATGIAPAAIRSFYMDPAQQQFGAWRVEDKATISPVKFSLFFPDRAKDAGQYEDRPLEAGGHYGEPQIKAIRVVGDFQEQLGQENWTENSENSLRTVDHPKGTVWTLETDALCAGFYEYKYAIEFMDGTKRWVTDPCSRYGGKDAFNQNSGFVIGPSAIERVEPLASRKPLRDLIVYELNLDDFSDEFRFTSAPRGTRSAVEAVCLKLDYLVNELGVNTIQFLPWTAWANDLYSWGYTPYQYFSVEHRYTNDDSDPSEQRETKQLSRLRHLITECHNRGIHVIMDGVFNHVGPDTSSNYSGFPYRWMYKNPDACPYVGTFGGTFPGLKDLDYHNGCTQEFIRDVCFYWMDEFQIDGIRFDNTVNFYISGEPRGLPMLLEDLDAHVPDSNFSLTIEHLDMSAASVTNTTKATSYWNNAQYQCAFDYLWNENINPHLLHILDSHAGLDGEKVATTYLSNHDHSFATWQCGARENVGSMNWFRAQPGAIALFTSPGTPLIQNGQEFAEDHWIPENDHNTGRRVKPRPLRWGYLDDGIGSSLRDMYARLISIRKSYAGLRSDNFYPAAWEEWQTQFNPQGYGIDVQKQVLIYHRWGNDEDGRLQRFIIVVNFSRYDQFVDVPFSVDGEWTDLLNSGTRVSPTECWVRNWKVNSNWGNVFFLQS